jgi:hypothetical protein
MRREMRRPGLLPVFAVEVGHITSKLWTRLVVEIAPRSCHKSDVRIFDHPHTNLQIF